MSEELLPCPSCHGSCRVAVSTSANPKDTWRKHIVGCDGVLDPNDDFSYLKEPCGLEITAYDDEREVDELIEQWQKLPRLQPLIPSDDRHFVRLRKNRECRKS